MKKLILGLMSVFALGLMLMPAGAALGACDPLCGSGQRCEDGNCVEATLDLGTGYGATTGLGSGDIRDTVASIINVAMGLLGIVAVVIILIGGFTWMTAGGNDEKVAEAKKWIFSGVIGLAIILSAYALANFVITNLIDATGASNAEDIMG